MTNNYLLAVSEITTNTVVDLSRLSSELIEYSQQFRLERQTEFLACRAILAQLLYQYFAIEQLPAITLAENSRPIFSDSRLPDFNISHSGNKIAVAIATSAKIGLDIEICRERKRWLALAQYAFSTGEVAWLQQLPASEQESAFWDLWTTRESVLKLAGKGVWQMKSIVIDPQSRHITTDFMAPIYNWSQQINGIFLAMSSDKSFDNIILYQADFSPLVRLIPIHTNANIHF